MIFGLDTAALPAAYMLAAVSVCAPQQPPVVTLDFTNKEPNVQNILSSKELGQFDVSTQFSHGRDEVFTTGGITAGHIGAGFELSFKKSMKPESGLFCLWLEKVAVSVDYAPQVHIASEYVPGSCRYQQTLQHEIRHVHTDLITLREFTPVIQQAVQSTVKTFSVAGPLPSDLVDQSQNEMGNTIKQALSDAVDHMDRIRLIRQQQIDTRQEYMRLSKACAGKEP